FTGFMTYHWLPDESFDPAKHIALASHEVCEGDAVERCGEMEDVWKDKKTGKIFVRDQFAEHRWQEGLRLGWLSFAYGLIGCTFFAYTMADSDPKIFRAKFVKALWVNLGFAAISFLAIWH